MKHILCGLFEIVGLVELGKGNFFGKETGSENVTFFHGISKVTLEAAIVLKRGSDVPAGFAVLAKCSAGFRRDMRDNVSAWRSNRHSIEIVVAKDRGMGQ